MKQVISKVVDRTRNLRWKYFSIHSKQNILSNRVFIKKYYKYRLGRDIDLKNPKLFSEKLNWLKIYYHDPLYTLCADKYRMREYVKLVLGEGYTVPLIKVYKTAEEIDFDELPDKFVLKTNHDGGPIICTDKNKLDKEATRQLLKEKLNNDYYARGREWAYKNIKRCIIAEPLLTEGDLINYKFFCFNGIARFLLVESEHTEIKKCSVNYFDLNFNKMPFKGHNKEADVTPEKPDCFDTMIEVSERLAAFGGFPFVRVDCYYVDGKILIGELTFYPGNGMPNWIPMEWNSIAGGYLSLPKKNGWKKIKDRDKALIKALISKI